MKSEKQNIFVDRKGILLKDSSLVNEVPGRVIFLKAGNILYYKFLFFYFVNVVFLFIFFCERKILLKY